MGNSESTKQWYQQLPYGQALQLLDDITHNDKHSICAVAYHWRDAARVLSDEVDGKKPVRAIALLEFAAQAMALHGVSQGAVDAAPKQVSVLSVKKITIGAPVDTNDAKLTVKATLVAKLDDSAQYRFLVSTDTATLLSGELLVLARDG